MIKELLKVHIKCYEPDEVINCINQFCPEVSGLCYFKKKYGELRNYNKNYAFYFDPHHKVIEVNEIL